MTPNRPTTAAHGAADQVRPRRHRFAAWPPLDGRTHGRADTAAGADADPRVTPTPEPRPLGYATDVPPPTGGPGALDQLILLGGVIGAGGLLVAVFLARRSPA